MQLQLAAANVLRLVVDHKLSLDDGLDRYFPQVGENRSQLQELCYGGCRFYFHFDAVLRQLLKKPVKPKDRIIHFLLIGALYQINYMRTPDHAAVNQCVNALKKTNQAWAKNLVNGVLRNYLRDHKRLIEEKHGKKPHSGHSGKTHSGTPMDTTKMSGGASMNNSTELAHKRSFPDFFIDQFKQSWPEHYELILKASNARPPMTLRVNQRLNDRTSYAKSLEDLGIGFELTQNSDTGLTLTKPMPVEDIPGFLEGEVSVQDESAQMTISGLTLKPGQRILDGCAAPGGKTCAILEAQPDLASVTAVDFKKRISGIKQNLERLKLTANLITGDVTHMDEWWDGVMFDSVLLDIPCSGSGVIRRHPDIKHRREPTDFAKFAEKQKQIITAGWEMLTPGGVLLYVTCSVLKQENDEVIGEFIKEYNDAQIESLDEHFGIETQFGRQRLPGIHPGDGFYFCRLNKAAGSKRGIGHSLS